MSLSGKSNGTGLANLAVDTNRLPAVPLGHADADLRTSQILGEQLRYLRPQLPFSSALSNYRLVKKRHFDLAVLIDRGNEIELRLAKHLSGHLVARPDQLSLLRIGFRRNGLSKRNLRQEKRKGQNKQYPYIH